MNSRLKNIKNGHIAFEKMHLFVNSFLLKIFQKIFRKHWKKDTIKIPYIIFAFVIAFWCKPIVLVADQDHFAIHYDSLFVRLYILLIMSPFMLLMLALFLKKNTIKYFLEENIKFPKEFNSVKFRYFEFIFLKSKLLDKDIFSKKDEKIPIMLRKLHLLYLFLIVILIPYITISIFLISITSDAQYSIVEIILNIFWYPIILFIVFTMGRYMVGVMYILYKLKKTVEDDKFNSYDLTVASLQKYEDLRKIPILLLFCFSGYLMAIPTLFMNGIYHSNPTWKNISIFVLFLGLAFLLLILILPNLFVYKIMNVNKSNIREKLLNKIEKTEKEISRDTYKKGLLEKYNAQQQMMKNLNNVRSLPTDIKSLSNIFIALLISNVYYVIQFLRWIAYS